MENQEALEAEEELSPTKILVLRAQQIYQVIQDFIITDEQCEQLVNKLSEALVLGMSQKGQTQALLKPKHTFINELINGEESGYFIGAFLGLYKLKLALLAKPRKWDPDFEIQQSLYLIPENLFTGDGRLLFDFIVNCLDCFLNGLGVDKKTFKFSLCFITPFPYEQTRLTDASFENFFHHFDQEGLIGMDINKLIRRAMKRQGSEMKIKCVFIINDSVGTLVAGARLFPNCKIALTIGIYTNAAYIQNTTEIEMPEEEIYEGRNYTILNTEWGKFGDNGGLEYLLTEVDKEMNLATKNKESYIFDKMVSGYYLGELVRRLLWKLVELECIFKDKPNEDLMTPFCLLTEDLIHIENDKPGKYKRCRTVLKRLGMVSVSDQDCSTVRYVCETVTTRSALLVASALASLIKKCHEGQKITIAIDGFVYRTHPFYAHLMKNKLKKLLKDSANYELVLTDYGPQVGGGLLAAAADRILCEQDVEEECITEVSSSIVEEEEEVNVCDIEIKLDPCTDKYL